MNKIYKTVWSAARGCVVAVNELCRAYDVGGNLGNRKPVEERKWDGGRKFVPSALMTALAGVFVLWGGNVEAAKTFPTDCASVGGTMKDGVCQIGDGTQVGTVLGEVKDVWTLTEGDMSIQGGSRGNAYGIEYIGPDYASGTIRNEGSGTLAILGGSATYAFGIYVCAWNYGSSGSIINAGSGTVLIQGGTGTFASGFDTIAYMYGSKGSIINEGSGTLTIQGGTGLGAYGIANFVRDSGGTGRITNAEGGTLNILGNVASNTYGIGPMTASTTAKAYIENAGVMNLNKNAIEQFGKGQALITNKATGTVNAEAETIFSKTQGPEVYEQPVIQVYSVDGGKWILKETKLSSFQTSKQSLSWSLKEDWADHSVWEDGGSLVITDVMAGSTSAQQITAAFQEKFGTGTSITFLGENDDASEDMEMPKFTAAVANDLIAQGFGGAVVTNFDLDVSSDEGTAQHVTIGQSGTNGITDSIGFRQILGASTVSVRGGKTLTLIGTIEGEDLVDGGGKVDLNNGTLRLGLNAGTAETTGYLTDVSIVNDSKVTAENGWFRMDKLSGAGYVTVAENGRVYAGAMNVTGSVKNEGTLSVDSLTVKGKLESSKTLKSSGTISVDAGSKLSANGTVVADKLDVRGVMILGKDAKVYTGAAAMDLLRRENAEAAAEIDRVEGKVEVNTMSVLDRIVAESMKKPGSGETDSNQGGDGSSAETSATGGTTSRRRAAPVLPQDAQAFAAFAAVSRITSDIERGTDPDGHGLWVKLQTNESEFDVRSGTKFEVNSDGAVIGAEAELSPSLKVGAAFSYLDGEIDSGLAKNSWTSYGLHAYAQYKDGDFGLKGAAGRLRSTTETAEDLNADVWHAGVRAEYDVFRGPLTVTPFVGVRLMSGSFDGTASKTVVNVPLGVKLAGELSTAGWTVVPALEASYVRSMGDTETDDLRVLPKNALEGILSLKVTTGAWSGELSYRGAAGSNDYEDRSFSAKVGMTF